MGALDDAELGNGDNPCSSPPQQQQNTPSCPPTAPPSPNSPAQLVPSEPRSTTEDPSNPTSPAPLRLVDIACGVEKLKGKEEGKEEEGEGDNGSSRLLQVVKRSVEGEAISPTIPAEERVV